MPQDGIGSATSALYPILLKILHQICHQQVSSSISIITVVVLPGSYYDAARWGLILGEVYGHVLLGVFGAEGAAEWPALGALAYALPEWVWQYAAYEHVAAYSAGHF